MGKSARDLFSKGFNYGNLKCEMKTLTSSGVNFTTGGSSKLDSGRLAASLEAKFDIKVGRFPFIFPVGKQLSYFILFTFPHFASVKQLYFLQ